MYYLRAVDAGSLALYSGLSLAWAAGGWLVATGAFSLRPRERIVAGAATGFLLFITLSNLLSPILGSPESFITSAVGVLLAGIAFARAGGQKTRPRLSDLKHAGPLLVLGVSIAFFQALLRGLALFDEYLHLPLVSVMAAGDIPPHFYLDPSRSFAYHYGLHVWAASLVRLAGFFPWSAWDLARAVSLGFTFVLSMFWFGRVVRERIAVLASAALALLAGGTRWLLLLVPTSTLAAVSGHVTLINSGANTAATLAEAMGRTWVLEGGGLVSIPFAFHNGVFVPAIFVLGSSGAMPFFSMLLLLLLGVSIRSGWMAGLALGPLLASLALSAEHLFAFVWLVLGGVLVASAVRRKPAAPAMQAGWIAWGVSGILALVQGGFITDSAIRAWETLRGAATSSVYNFHGFGLRWPPALPTAHFAEVSIANGWALLALAAELGPVLLLAPLATVYAGRLARRGRWAPAALGLAALPMFAAAWLIRYGVDRSMTRFPATALWLWLVLGLPAVWILWRRGSPAVRASAAALAGAAAFSGVVLLGLQMTSVPNPQFSYYIEGLDTEMAARYWGRLPTPSMVLDRSPYRSVALFGQPVVSSVGLYTYREDWRSLIASPTSDRVSQAGFAYVYMDESWWSDLTPATRETYRAACVSLVDEVVQKNVLFRRLYDVRACSAGAG